MHRTSPPIAPTHRVAHLSLLYLLSTGLSVAWILLCSAHAGIWAQSSPKSSASSSRPSSSRTSTPRIDLRPNLVPGSVLRYQVQLQTTTDTKRSGAVSDPQGPSRLTVTWDATIRLEVLGAAPAGAPVPKPVARKSAPAELNLYSAPMRIRTTYERSVATVQSDSPDPEAEQTEQKYARLQGVVIEFTVGTDGHVSDVHGLENVLDEDQVRQAAEQWMAQVSAPTLSRQGVALGQTWNSAQPANSMPLAGMIWRSVSTYLRNESCRPAEPSAAPPSQELCAVILTRQSVLPQKQVRDATPDDYRRQGMRTSGHWAGSGESLSYVSLQTHSAVSVTQDSTQQIDFSVTNSSGYTVRFAGTIETHSRVALLPPDAPIVDK
jgi:hypothetical protein